MRDYYEILGVERTCDAGALKASFRKLAMEHHPDRNAGCGEAEGRFKEITEAHSVLSDPAQRAEYDQIRAMGSGARFTAGGQGRGFEDQRSKEP